MFSSYSRRNLINMNLYKNIKKTYMQDSLFIRENLKAYFDISVNNNLKGRIVFTLFAKDCPRTALNFFHLCKGDKTCPESGKKLHYKGSKFHRIIPGFMAQGGDFLNGNGTGSISIYGKKFGDENFVFSHDRAGMLSMANSGPNSNGSQFFITFADAGWLDGKHVVFGKITEGINILNEIEFVGTQNGKPKADVIIQDCGVLEEEKKEASSHGHGNGHDSHKH
jgi:peptidylprolyl isomerase